MKEEVCKLCNGTGISEYFEMNNDIHDGSYEVKELIDKYGGMGLCPDCSFKPSN